MFAPIIPEARAQTLNNSDRTTANEPRRTTIAEWWPEPSLACSDLHSRDACPGPPPSGCAGLCGLRGELFGELVGVPGVLEGLFAEFVSAEVISSAVSDGGCVVGVGRKRDFHRRAGCARTQPEFHCISMVEMRMLAPNCGGGGAGQDSGTDRLAHSGSQLPCLARRDWCASRRTTEAHASCQKSRPR